MKRLVLPAVIATTAILFSCNNNAVTTATTTDSLVPVLTAGQFDSTVDGKATGLYFISNSKGVTAALTNYGARMVSLMVPDKKGVPTEVLVGFNNIHDFVSGAERYFGAIVGRYGNRIAKGKFTLDGKSYQLAINNDPNSLHGGPTGVHSRVWDAKLVDKQTIAFTYVSADGEEGYPGTLTSVVTYKLTDDNAVEISFELKSDKNTVINLTNHNYWNLNGEGSGTINNHTLQISAAKYTPVDSTLIPTGIAPVAGTPFDFTKPVAIGARVNEDNTQLKYGKGYDHNFVLDKGITATPQLVAVCTGDQSGIVMEVLTTEPGLQFYGGNFMQSKNTIKTGGKDDHRTALCLETQHFPDSPNQPSFPTTVLKAGDTYKSTSIFKFSVAK